jgi:hypothetical protein
MTTSAYAVVMLVVFHLRVVTHARCVRILRSADLCDCREA